MRARQFVQRADGRRRVPVKGGGRILRRVLFLGIVLAVIAGLMLVHYFQEARARKPYFIDTF